MRLRRSMLSKASGESSWDGTNRWRSEDRGDPDSRSKAMSGFIDNRVHSEEWGDALKGIVCPDI